MEETSFIEDMEKIQKAISNTKGNILSFLSDRDYLLELVEMYRGMTLKYEEENDKRKRTKFHPIFLGEFANGPSRIADVE